MTVTADKAPKVKTIATAVGPHTNAKALHVANNESHLVAIGNLTVVISRDGKGWFAQGLEIDYAAGGPTLAKAKKNFQKGLKGTIHLHLKLYETIDKLLKPAPPKVWKDNYWVANSKQFTFSQVSFHSGIPQLDKIVFCEPREEVAA